MTVKQFIKEARKAMRDGGSENIAFLYNPSKGPGYFANSDGEILRRSSCDTPAEFLDSDALKDAFRKEGLKFKKALTGLYHLTRI